MVVLVIRGDGGEAVKAAERTVKRWRLHARGSDYGGGGGQMTVGLMSDMRQGLDLSSHPQRHEGQEKRAREGKVEARWCARST